VNTEGRLEIEVKIRVGALTSWRDKLLALGAEVLAPRVLEKNLVFDTPRKRLKRIGILLRLRRAGRRSVLTMKMPARAPEGASYKVREETEADVSDFAAVERILRGIGFRPFFVYEKYREVFRMGGAGVMLDETPIGNFLEIEGSPAEIDGAAALLGFSRGDYISDSYYRLFLLSGRAGDMVFSR
jgi:adenylate cyclase, class 2